MRELDLIRVVGREAPISVYEPLCLAAEADAAVNEKISAFAAALALYRRRDLEAAATALDTLGPGDTVAARLAARARGMIAEPPPPIGRALTSLCRNSLRRWPGGIKWVNVAPPNGRIPENNS